MNKNNQPNRCAAIQGFTLVELLISMVLSLFLIGGVISIYVSSKQTSHTREELSSLDDNGRAAIRALTQYIEHAGYATPKRLALDHYLISTAGVINATICGLGSDNLSGSSIVSGTTVNDSHDGIAAAKKPAPDRITIAMLSDATLSKDCSGQALQSACVAVNAPIYNSFYIQTAVGDTEPSLYCNGSVGAAPIKLAEGVEDMQIKYGVDSQGNDLIADQYLDATAMAGWWDNVVSVQVAVLVSSIKDVRTKQTAQTYLLLDRPVLRNDRKQHAVFTTEIRLRNVLL